MSSCSPTRMQNLQRLSPAGEFNASLTFAPESKVTNGMGVQITHSQTNLQLMYSHRF